MHSNSREGPADDAQFQLELPPRKGFLEHIQIIGVCADVFVFVVHLNALFFGLSLKYQELSRTIPYFSTFCHILNIVCKNNDFIPYIVILSAFYRFLSLIEGNPIGSVLITWSQFAFREDFFHPHRCLYRTPARHVH